MVNNELLHYGTMGMRWGVRKKNESSNRESESPEKKKSNHRLKLEEKYQTKGMSQEEAEKAASRRVRAEKFVAVAGVITVAAATAYVATRTIKILDIEKDIQKNMPSIFDTSRNNGITSLSDLPTIKTNHSIIDDLKSINPRYPTVRPTKWGAKDSVWETNCGYCATAFEMRRRGFDVEAVSNGRGMSPITPLSLFEGVEIKTTTPKSAIDDIRKECIKWGEGARGMVSVSWKGGGGHAFSFEHVDNYGLPEFMDPQVNSSNAMSYFSKASSVRFIRLDNLEPTDKMLDAIKIKRG